MDRAQFLGDAVLRRGAARQAAARGPRSCSNDAGAAQHLRTCEMRAREAGRSGAVIPRDRCAPAGTARAGRREAKTAGDAPPVLSQAV